MVPSTVRDGLKTRLETITGLRVYDVIPDVVVPPCAVVGQLNFVFDTAFNRGLDTATVDIYVIVQRVSERAGQDKLDAYLAGTGAGSIKTAIEGDKTLAGAVNTLQVVSAESGTYISGDTSFISYKYSLNIWG